MANQLAVRGPVGGRAAHRFWLAGAWLIGLAICWGGYFAEAQNARQATRYLLLKNGQELAGEVSYEGEHYRLRLPSGEIRVPRDDVAQLCRDLDEVLAVKRAGLQPDDLHGQVRLIEWCIDRRLLGPAEVLLAEAEARAAHHSRVQLTRRLLELAQRTPTQAPAVPMLEAQREEEQERLEHLTRALPEGTVEAFRRTIQPNLLVGCAAARCHGSNSGHELRLFRPTGRNVLTRRSTQRNLESLLRWIDREAPAQSPLLVAAATPHGNLEEAVYGPAQQQRLDTLTAWVESVATSEHVSQPATVATATTPDSPPTLSQALVEPRNRQPSRAAGSKDEPQQRGGDAETDPCDPAIFNRRHHDSEVVGQATDAADVAG